MNIGVRAFLLRRFFVRVKPTIFTLISSPLGGMCLIVFTGRFFAFLTAPDAIFNVVLVSVNSVLCCIKSCLFSDGFQVFSNVFSSLGEKRFFVFGIVLSPLGGNFLFGFHSQRGYHESQRKANKWRNRRTLRWLLHS